MKAKILKFFFKIWKGGIFYGIGMTIKYGIRMAIKYGIEIIKYGIGNTKYGIGI